MERKIKIHKKGRLNIYPLWVSLNNGKYNLYTSNPIELSTEQKENSIKIRDLLFIYSRKADIQIEDTSASLNVKTSNLNNWLRLGTFVVPILIILYFVQPCRFIPTQILFYILFGYLGIAILLPLIFKREGFFNFENKTNSK